jgi:hypothetical protein
MNLFEQVITSADQQHLTQNVQLRRLTTLVSRDEVNGQTDAPACFTSQLGLITCEVVWTPYPVWRRYNPVDLT